MTEMLNLTLKVWRQEGPDSPGAFETYTTTVADDASFLEMLDYVNEDLITNDREPIVFDHDCREGICGTCGVMIDGQAHGPQKGTATCQLHMRQYNDGDEIVIEPFRSAAFPVVKDLMVNRATFDRIIEAGGYIDVTTGGNVIAPIPSGPGYQVPFASEIRHRTKVPTAAVGMINEPFQAEQIVVTGQADVVLLGRETMRDPNFPIRAAQILRHPEPPIPPAYARAH